MLIEDKIDSKSENELDLDLSSCGATYLPTTINKFIKVQKIDLSENKFTVFPEEIFQLKTLETIILSGNKLTTIPENFSSLKNILRLDLSRNRLIDIPENLDIGNLSMLNLNENLFSNFPRGISNQKYLFELDLGRNRLSNKKVNNIENIFENLRLPNLNKLNLSNNNLTYIPEGIQYAPKLEHLNLNRNNFYDFPVEVFKLDDLQTLDLSENQIKLIPPIKRHLDKWCFEKLSKLDISGNSISQLSLDFDKLIKLKTLYLCGNKFENSKDIFSKLPPNLKRLYLRGNNFESVPQNLLLLKNLTYVDIEYNKLSCIPDDVLNKAKFKCDYEKQRGLEDKIINIKNINKQTVVDKTPEPSAPEPGDPAKSGTFMGILHIISPKPRPEDKEKHEDRAQKLREEYNMTDHTGNNEKPDEKAS